MIHGCLQHSRDTDLTASEPGLGLGMASFKGMLWVIRRPKIQGNRVGQTAECGARNLWRRIQRAQSDGIPKKVVRKRIVELGVRLDEWQKRSDVSGRDRRGAALAILHCIEADG